MWVHSQLEWLQLRGSPLDCIPTLIGLADSKLPSRAAVNGQYRTAKLIAVIA
jgi:hypothetical protein